eukprot:4943696-Prymnesium_polylepis.1
MVHRSLVWAVVRWAESGRSAAVMRGGLAHLADRDMARALNSWKAVWALSTHREAALARALSHMVHR